MMEMKMFPYTVAPLPPRSSRFDRPCHVPSPITPINVLNKTPTYVLLFFRYAMLMMSSL